MNLQFVVDTCGKIYPTLKKLKGLFNQLYAYAMKNDICNKDYSEFVDLSRYKDKNPNKRDRNKFTKEQIARLWELAEDPYYQIVLMLIYNGCRISEFLDLKKENVHLEEQYFDVIASKTENGLKTAYGKFLLPTRCCHSTKRGTKVLSVNICSIRQIKSTLITGTTMTVTSHP